MEELRLIDYYKSLPSSALLSGVKVYNDGAEYDTMGLGYAADAIPFGIIDDDEVKYGFPSKIYITSTKDSTKGKYVDASNLYVINDSSGKELGNIPLPFAQGGEVIFTNLSNNTQSRKEWEGKKARPDGKVAFGSFSHKKDNKLIGSYYLYRLNDFDEDYYSHIPLKEGEILARVQTEGMIFDEMPLVKINIKNGRVYFMSETEDDKNSKFSKSSADVTYLFLDKAIQKYAERKGVYGKGGEIGKVWVVYNSNNQPDSIKLTEEKANQYIKRRSKLSQSKMTKKEMSEDDAMELFSLNKYGNKAGYHTPEKTEKVINDLKKDTGITFENVSFSNDGTDAISSKDGYFYIQIPNSTKSDEDIDSTHEFNQYGVMDDYDYGKNWSPDAYSYFRTYKDVVNFVIEHKK